jgi:two-component system cell cycle response regulator
VQELQRARRYGHTLSMLMLDIDHFKQVNDTFGHMSGDSVLKALARRIEREIRQVDSIYRYGGEEIALLLPETSPSNALDIAERIRSVVERRPFTIDQQRTWKVTVSVGVAAFPDHADSPDELLAAADKVLYQVKEGGRNQVRMAETY